MEQLNIQKIIKDISPFYNSYKESNKNSSGVEALQLMGEIGDILK